MPACKDPLSPGSVMSRTPGALRAPFTLCSRAVTLEQKPSGLLPSLPGSMAMMRLPQLAELPLFSTAPPASAPARISTISAKWLPL